MAIYAHIIGNLGADAETRSTQGAHTITNFRIASTDGFGDKKETTWVQCDWWGERGSKVQSYLLKGTSIAVRGRVSLKTFTTKDGEVKSSIAINVEDVTLLGKREDRGADNRGGAQKSEPARTGGGGRDGFNAPELDDEIPFATPFGIW